MPWLWAGASVLLLLVALWPPALSTISDGPTLGGDSGRYIAGGDALLEGASPTNETWPYIGYIVVVAGMRAIGLGLPGVVVVQLILAAMALWAIYLLGRSLAGPAGGLLSAALVASFTHLHRWHAAILTDSLFISWSVLLVFSAHRWVDGRSWRWLPALVVTAIATATTRPHGWIVLVVVLCWLVVVMLESTPVRIGGIAVVIAGIAVVAMPVIGSGVSHASPAAMMREGYVLWMQDTWKHAMPTEAGAGAEGVGGLIGYAVRHPLASGGLILHRMGAALVQARPYYGAARNIILVLSVSALYGAAAVGSLRGRRFPLVSLLVALIAANLIFIGVTFADYDGRFGTYLVPWFAVLAAPAVSLRRSGLESRTHQ